MSGTGHWIVGISETGDPLIDGVLSGYAWGGLTIYYSSPDSSAEYDYQNEPLEYAPLGANEEFAAHTALNTYYGGAANDGFSVEGFTNLDITHTYSDDAHIRLANTGYSDEDSDTAWAYLPDQTVSGGDVWFHRDFSAAEAGNYEWAGVYHEIGHALGLKHGHEDEAYGALPAAQNSMEYSIMTYATHVGADTEGSVNSNGWSFPQTFMMSDIAALQHMYGADFTTNGGDTVYRWNPDTGDTLVNGEVGIASGANKIFATIWDGGGIDTYDLSLYSSNLKLDLTPGSYSVFSQLQLARLGAFHDARGNIFNALLYEGDTRSLIENAIGGSGSDLIVGNQADNTLVGNSGRDVLQGGEGNDNLLGGLGDDLLDGGLGRDLLFGEQGDDTLTVSLGEVSRGDVFDGGVGTDTLYFALAKDGYRFDLVNGELSWGYGRTAVLRNIENVHAGDADDEIIGDANANLLRGMAGDDYIRGNAGNDTIDGGAGDDRLEGGFGDDAIRYFDGVGAGAGERIDGGRGSDKLLIQAAGDQIFNFQGLEVASIEEIEFHDSAAAGWVVATFDADVFDTDREFAGDLLIDGNDQTGLTEKIEIVMGETERLVLSDWQFEDWGGQGETIEVDGDRSSETIVGSTQADVIDGNGGNDTLLGYHGDDTIDSGEGDDRVYGGNGMDVLSGGEGDDTLDGGKDTDYLEGGEGNDYLIGGEGADRFTFHESSGEDFIADFEAGLDQIVFRRTGRVDEFDDLSLYTVRDKVLIDYGSGTVVLDDVSAKDLSESDFLFM